MEISQKTKFMAALGIQLLVIFSIIIFKLAVLRGGTEIMLHVKPADPTDYLRGDYVSFQYDISSIDPYRFGYSPVKAGDAVYVPLVKSGKYWIVSGMVTKSKPSGGGKIFIRGTVISEGNNCFSEEPKARAHYEPSMPPIKAPCRWIPVRVKYGIEEYFIPEGAGRNFSFFDHEVSAKAAVDDYGNSLLKQVYVDGKTWPD